MIRLSISVSVAAVAAVAVVAAGNAVAEPPYGLDWVTVVNNGDAMPTTVCDPVGPPSASCRNFNSYSQPSVTADQTVVFRARSRGGQGLGQPVHGVYRRDVAASGPVMTVLDRGTLVPQPNNRDAVFTESPSFPRIDLSSGTVATRGNHPPVWQMSGNADELAEPLGTSGIYADPFGSLITGAAKLGSVRDYSFFEVPEAPGTPFDVFPGAPAVTRGATIVFKGNFTLDLIGRTGVYFRDLIDAPIPTSSDAMLAPGSGTNPVVLIANNVDTLIPGTSTYFGSTGPPSAAGNEAVFTGLDDESNPTLGGIYLARLTPYPAGEQPALHPLVEIGDPVPDETQGASFARLGEALSFDGRFVAFWGAWGTETKTLRLYCPQEGNQTVIAYCNRRLVLASGRSVGDADSVCDDVDDPMHGISCYQEKQVSVMQGVFVHDLKAGRNGRTHVVATTNGDVDDFVYWTYSGRVPGVGGEHGEGTESDGEAARWRSATFVAVSGLADGRLKDPRFYAAFKARKGVIDPVTHVYADPLDAIYLRSGAERAALQTLVETGMPGTLLDPEAVDEFGLALPVTEIGIERDGFRGASIVVNARMGTEETGWGGIYLGEVRIPERRAAPGR